MTGFSINIEDATLNNSNFRNVLFTGKYCQLVVMNLLPNEEIGVEVHDTVDQFFRIESGNAKVTMNNEDILLSENDAFIVPAGVEHNVKNTSSTESLKLYTIYSPPNHKEGTVHTTKAEAMLDEDDHL